MHQLYVGNGCIVPYVVPESEVYPSESNTSFIARVAWRYRVRPAKFIGQLVLQNTGRHTSSLSSDVAISCNSLTNKSLSIAPRLFRLTGNPECLRGNFTYLRHLLDHGAHGLIDKHKKWCAECYRESFGQQAEMRRGWSSVIYDKTFWSLSIARYCDRHLCTLSVRCGACYERQPYVSSKYEPGYCHYCAARLDCAPSICVDEEDHSAEKAQRYLNRMDIFLPVNDDEKQFSLGRLAKNLRALMSAIGPDGLGVVSECCGVSPETLKDWCSLRHNLSLESLLKVIDGFGVDKASLLFGEFDVFSNAVGPQFSKQFNFHVKKDRRPCAKDIAIFLNKIISGDREPMPRKAIAKVFGVSVGMLENAYKPELARISRLYQGEVAKQSLKAKDSLQYEMNKAVQRCGSKMRSFSWPHVFAELKNIDLRHVKQVQLDRARTAAINKYEKSARRDKSRDISSLFEQ